MTGFLSALCLDIHLENIREVVVIILVSRNVRMDRHETKRAQEPEYITGNKGMVDLGLNHIKHNLFIGVKWQRM